jgi:ferric-chelate reductase
VSQAEAITSVSLRISVHYTRAFATSTISVEDLDLPYGLTLDPGRPELGDMLSASIGCVSALKRSTREGVHGVVVGVCGPEELMSHVRQVENAIGSKVRAAVGGVELVEECVTFFNNWF